MKLGQKAISIFGTLALGLSLTAGAAFANDGDSSSSMDLALNVTCLEVTDVEVSGNGSFAPIDVASGANSTSTAAGAINVEVNVGCYFGGWRVDAEITNFRNSAENHSFAGNRFSLEAGNVTSVLPIPPHAHDSTFGGNDADNIFHTTNLLNWLGIDPSITEIPAPWTSTANYTGHLNNLPNLHEGNYVSTLTTILTLED